MGGRPQDSVRLQVEVPERVTAGEPVAILLSVENVSSRPVTLYLTGRPVAFDVVDHLGPTHRHPGARAPRRLHGASL